MVARPQCRKHDLVGISISRAVRVQSTAAATGRPGKICCKAAT